MFSVTDAAFAGFRVLQRNPILVAFWAVLLFVFNIASLLLIAALAGPAMAELQAAGQAGASADPQVMMRSLAQVGPVYLIIIAVSFLYYGMIYAAANRAILNPDDSRYGYLRFGAAELRQALLLFLLTLLLMAAYVVAVVLCVIVFALVGAAGGGGGGAMALGILVASVLVIACLCALLWLAVKFSLASPQTFATGKLNLFGSWALTKGRVWPALGAYLLSWLLAAIISAVAFGIFLVIAMMIAGMGSMAQIFQPDMSSVSSVLNPLTISYYAVMSIVGGATTVIFLTPPADIYRQVAKGDSASAFD